MTCRSPDDIVWEKNYMLQNNTLKNIFFTDHKGLQYRTNNISTKDKMLREYVILFVAVTIGNS